MSDAVFSPCRTWRYRLTRDVAPLTGKGVCTFVGLNPSTADETADDPTIRRCIRFARDWGFARLVMVNLYGFRATDPAELTHAADPIGPENDHYLALAFSTSDLTVAAWGTKASPERAAAVLAIPPPPRVCLGLTKHGAPRHPLYVPASTRAEVAFSTA